MFWKAYGVCKEGGWTKAIQQWERQEADRDVAYPTFGDLGERKHQLPDHEAIDELSSALRSVEARATPDGKVVGRDFLVAYRINRRRKENRGWPPDNNEGDQVRVLLRGWIDLTGAKTEMTV